MAQKNAEQAGDKQPTYQEAAKHAAEAVKLAQQTAQAAETAQKAAEEGMKAAQAMIAQNPPPAPTGAPPPQVANPELASAAGQQAPIAQAAMEVGQDISRAGRHEQRLQISPLASSCRS
jgi:hypothetical protein